MSCPKQLRYIIDSCGENNFGNCMFVFAGTATIFEDPEKGIKTYKVLDQRLVEICSKSNPYTPDMRQTVMRLEKGIHHKACRDSRHSRTESGLQSLQHRIENV